MRLRQSYLCGDSNALKGFQSLAEATSRTLIGVSELEESELAGDVADLFRNPRGGIRYVFGTVTDPPGVFVARGWQPGVLVYPEGVLIDLPIAETTPNVEHWLLLLHRLAWRRNPGSPLQGQRLAWHENTTVPYEWVVEREFDAGFPEQWKERFAQIPTTSYYSILGTQEHPLDVNLASAFAIGLLLSAKAKSAGGTKPSSRKADYSKEAWYGLPMPLIIEPPGTAAALKRQLKPKKVVLLTATPTERDTVLKHLQPLPDTAGVIRLFHENNTFFLGRLGYCTVVLCMCSMGASGRDSAQIVTGEVLRFWKPAALIMVGIAFGRDSERQKIGDVLISERIIAYEPERVGSESTISRGQQFLPGTRLYNSFRNADIDWSFRDPNGLLCALHFGPILSGEKLIDNPDFKSRLFEKHPNAIGGDMEGVGVASCAEREKHEWILVKAICDWADGDKTDNHHGFAAASAVSFVQHVLSQPGAVSSK